MDPSIVVILGVAIALSVLGLVYEKFQIPWGSSSPLRDVPDEVTVMGRTIAIEHLRAESGRAFQKGPPRTGYRVTLPSAMAGLGLIDTEARDRWWETVQYGKPPTEGSPTTGDPIFDGTFMFTAGHRDARSLDEPEVRAALLEAREACHGIWVCDGELCIIERAPYTESAAEVAGAYLAGVVERIEAALDPSYR